jgi:6-phosphogluconolactonase (cycloisomerase 2 family)
MLPFMRRQQVWAVLPLLLTLLLTLAVPTSAADLSRQDDGCAGGSCSVGAVYALTNAVGGNAVVAYHRAANGGLTPASSFATGGTGTGAGLGSQGAVVVSDDHQLLFAVNAGSNSISSFRIGRDGLKLVSVVPSGGAMPTSVAHRHGLVYVLNAGTPNSVTGFAVAHDGTLTPLAGSARPLSADSTSPAQVAFDAHGEAVIVTERATNRISTYRVGSDGLLTGPAVYPSAGPTPFGFAISNQNTLLVSEAGAGGGASTYQIGDGGALTPASSMLMTGQRAACWAVVTPNGRFGYVTNAGTGNISGFALGQGGAATLLDVDGVTAVTGGNPTDAALSHNGRFLYVRVGALSAIAIFAIGADGSLQPLPALPGTPAGLAGLAAY